MESFFLGFLVEVVRLMKMVNALPFEISSKHFSKFLAAGEIIDNDIAAAPTAQELSQRVGIDITTLRTIFDSAFKTSTSDYIRGRRLEQARTLLRTQTIPVSDVSYCVGCTNAATFAPAYRKHFGHPPSK